MKKSRLFYFNESVPLCSVLTLQVNLILNDIENLKIENLRITIVNQIHNLFPTLLLLRPISLQHPHSQRMELSPIQRRRLDTGSHPLPSATLTCKCHLLSSPSPHWTFWASFAASQPHYPIASWCIFPSLLVPLPPILHAAVKVHLKICVFYLRQLQISTKVARILQLTPVHSSLRHPTIVPEMSW